MSLSPQSLVHCVAKMTFCVECDSFKTKEANMLNGSWREWGENVVDVGVLQFVQMFNDSHLSMTRCSWQTILFVFAYNNGLPVLRHVRNRAFKAKWNCRHVNFTRVLGEFSTSFVSATNEILSILNTVFVANNVPLFNPHFFATPIISIESDSSPPGICIRTAVIGLGSDKCWEEAIKLCFETWIEY